MNHIRNQARRLVTLLACALFLGVCASAAAAKELNGYYEGDNGGAYFIRQIGADVYWFGEDPNGAWANVLMGTVSGDKITARFWDVPKGRTQGMGGMILQIQGDGATLVKLSSTTPFGTKSWKKTVVHAEMVNGVPVTKGFPPEMRSLPQGYSVVNVFGEQNLTGAWQGDDAAFYYVRETSLADQVPDIVWVAENNQWGGPGGNIRPSFTHVFFGKHVKGDPSISGRWIDIPKGEAAGSGTLTLTIKGPQDMETLVKTGSFAATTIWRSLPNNLRGFADLHAHPMVNLGFGGKLVHGGLDVGSLLTIDADCNHNVRAKNIAQALDRDNGTHGGYSIGGILGLGSNPCGDIFRNAIHGALQEGNHAAVTPDNAVGFPSFKDWPLWNDITHQKMWVDWIRRSYDSGQRVMVALAVNNYTIAAGVSGPGDGPTDDKASADLQIAEIARFVARHNDFMEVALTPADLRRIVALNKMAIVLGVEIDNIGNFNQVGVSGQMISNEVQRLYDEGVRYIFPIHLIDNKFGGTAVYQDVFNLSNYHVTGKWWDLQCGEAGERIYHQFIKKDFELPLAAAKVVKLKIDFAREPPDPPKCGGQGHKNKLGLTSMGDQAISEMMARGMLIDIDHMSQLAANATLDKAGKVPGGYPLVSGHNQMRSASGEPNENNRTPDQLNKIAALGGMFGLGSDAVTAAGYLNDYLTASQSMVIASKGLVPRHQVVGRVAFGTDLNGLVRGPRPVVALDFTTADLAKASQIKACYDRIYNSSFVMSETGDKKWNYCTAGVAHYGMLADFLKDMYGMDRGADLRANIMANAEMFARMWEKAVKNSANVQR
jgi:microsomal dipeptidase-like Zn-dependent dipeptidase